MQRVVRQGALNPVTSIPSYSSHLLLTDTPIYALYGKTLNDQLSNTTVFLAPQGEEAKSLQTAERCWQTMIEAGLDRKSALITLGGGSICDLGGFVASTYMRGIALIHCPTTLLAMVDASIGGKSALNFGGEKNLLGTFHQPTLVIADTNTLESLEADEIRAGYAEVVKKGMTFDPDLLTLKDLEEVVERCSSIKEKVCHEDERGHGKRALLNWGHTFAHAIESGLNYQIRHGEAVAIGMSCAAFLSVEMGLCDVKLIYTQEEALERRGLSSALPDLDLDDLVQRMGRDKKSTKGEISCVVSRGVGQMELAHGIDPALIGRALRAKRKFYVPCS